MSDKWGVQVNADDVLATMTPDLIRRAVERRHRRECSAFDGGTANRHVPAPRFTGQHAWRDVFVFTQALRDYLDALGVPFEVHRSWQDSIMHDYDRGLKEDDHTGGNRG